MLRPLAEVIDNARVRSPPQARNEGGVGDQLVGDLPCPRPISHRDERAAVASALRLLAVHRLRTDKLFGDGI